MEYDKNILAKAKKQIATLAIRHLERMDARTLTIFQKHGMLDSLKSEVSYEDILPILKDTKHPDRRDIGTGPLFCYLAKKEPPEANIVEIADLLFANDIQLRKEALDYFNNLQDDELPILTSKSRGTLKALGGDILSEEKHKWRDAAVAVHDALEDDWYCNYAALKQCLSKNFIPGIEHHLTKVIRPTVSSIDSITPGVWEASKQKEKIQAKIGQIVTDNPNLINALDEYLMVLGHIPLASDLSIISLVDKWQHEYGKIKGIWKKLWNWADSYNLPLPRYHVCTYFVLKPSLVPKASYKDFWHEIAEIVSISGDENTDHKWTQSWNMFCEIARHYCCHLETRLPYMNGERIVSQAWWLALQMCKAFSSEDNLKHLRTETFLPELALSSRVWQIASPSIQPSSFRLLTFNTYSVFAFSLQAILFDKLDSINLELIDKSDFKKIEHVIGGTILAVYPPVFKKNTEVIYAFDNSPLNTAKKIVSYIDKDSEQKEMIDVFVMGIEKLMESESLPSLLSKISDSHSGDQVLIATYFKNRVFTEDVSLEDIWKVVEEPNWREAALIKSHSVVLEFIFGALNEIETRYQDKWAYNLPHFYALACEKCEDIERKEQLFTCTIHSSLCGNTVSGIQRLLKSKDKQKYKDYVNYWRTILEDTHRWAPEWVKAKIRPVLAVLHL